MLSLPAARPAGVRTRAGRGCRAVPVAKWIPDYGLSKQKPPPSTPSGSESSLDEPSSRKWWDYRAPTASVGRSTVQLSLGSLPQISPGDGDGGNNGARGGGGGGGGGGGDPMKGFTYLFSTLIVAGGLAAYIRKGSSSSFFVSLAVAILLLISASLLHHRSGKLLALGTCLVLATAMGHRANRSKKVFPAGVVAILSAAMTIGYARSLA